MRRGLIGHDVGGEADLEEPGVGLGGVAEQTDRFGAFGGASVLGPGDGLVEVLGPAVEIAGLDAFGEAGWVDLDAQGNPTVHRDGQGLGPAHASQARGEHDTALQAPLEALDRQLGQGLVGALQDALRADVDPRPGGHLAVHREAEGLEAVELIEGRPVGDQHGVRDQDPRGAGVGAEATHGLAGLDQEGLVLAQIPELGGDGVEGLPRAGRTARATVDDQVLGPLGDLRIEVVHQHPERRLLRPSATRELGSTRGSDGFPTLGHASPYTPKT